MDSSRDAVMSKTGHERREIHGDIARTRVELADTVHEIHERLRPDRLKQEATDAARRTVAATVRRVQQAATETAQTIADRSEIAGRDTVDYFRTHPTQTALVIGALTYWLMNRSKNQRSWRRAGDDGFADNQTLGTRPSLRHARSMRSESDVRGTVGEGVDRARETAGQYIDSAREKVSQYAASVGEVAGDVAESARTQTRHASEQLRDVTYDASRTVRVTWDRTNRSVHGWIGENPLAAAAIAVAVGTAVGLSAPQTAVENRTLGEARDQAMRAAGHHLSELQDEVIEKAEKALDAVTE